nr:uncharacterized protein LOC109180246 [Ipomoea batatas]
MPPSKPVTSVRLPLSAVEKGKGKVVDATLEPTLVARLPSISMVIGASPTTVALAAAHQPRLRKRNSDPLHQPLLKRRSFSEPGLTTPLREDVLKAFKESEDFHDEAMAHASMHARTIVDQWLEGEVGRQHLLDFVTPDDNRGAEDVALNASVDTLGDKILMDNAYLESAANVDSVARMNRTSIPTLTEVDRINAVATGEEEDPSDALQLNRQGSRNSERNLPIGPSEAGTFLGAFTGDRHHLAVVVGSNAGCRSLGHIEDPETMVEVAGNEEVSLELLDYVDTWMCRCGISHSFIFLLFGFFILRVIDGSLALPIVGLNIMWGDEGQRLELDFLFFINRHACEPAKLSDKERVAKIAA